MGRKLIEPATDGGEKKEGKNTRPIGVQRELMKLAMRVVPHR